MLPHELEALAAEWGEPRYRAHQVFQWLHRRGVLDPAHMTDLPLALRERLTPPRSEEVRRLRSSDGLTTKLLLRLHDGQEIEAVEMNTAPQAGCAMGCVFCVTGQFGFARNLEAGEIVEQVLRFNDPLRPVTNVVFMGMGEPLANYAQTVRALRLLVHPAGLRLGARRITLSTSGLVPQIHQLADENLQIGLAISLHAPNDELRSHLMPVNRRWPIIELLGAADAYVARTGRRVSYEYTLMAGVNDSDELADELAALLARRLCHVNLIPLNPTEDRTLQAPSMHRALAFETRLREAGIAATIRINRGRDIQAACGQLRLAEKRRREDRPSPSSGRTDLPVMSGPAPLTPAGYSAAPPASSEDGGHAGSQPPTRRAPSEAMVSS
jgi:23S rRNA (adenine2503-C2)-methyltransferase